MASEWTADEARDARVLVASARRKALAGYPSPTLYELEELTGTLESALAEIERLTATADHLKAQTGRLADYILEYFASDITEGGAVDVAIRLLDELGERREASNG